MGKSRRRGRYLDPMPVSELFAADDEMREKGASLERQGFTLTKTVRPYLRADGLVTLRFVWRKRSAGSTITHEHILRLPLLARKGG